MTDQWIESASIASVLLATIAGITYVWCLHFNYKEN